MTRRAGYIIDVAYALDLSHRTRTALSFGFLAGQL